MFIAVVTAMLCITNHCDFHHYHHYLWSTSKHCLICSIVSGVSLTFLFPGRPKVLGHSLSNTCCGGDPPFLRVPTNADQPTLQTPVYKSLASLLYKSNPFRSPGRKSTPRPQAVLLNLHKLLGARFPTPTHHIDRCPSTFLYILRIRILD